MKKWETDKRTIKYDGKKVTKKKKKRIKHSCNGSKYNKKNP
jgi:hypothetical protein